MIFILGVKETRIIYLAVHMKVCKRRRIARTIKMMRACSVTQVVIEISYI